MYAKRGQFGKFASQWLSRRGWAVGQAAGQSQATIRVSDKSNDSAPGDAAAAVAVELEDGAKKTDNETEGPAPSPAGQSSIDAMIPKILRSSRLILSSRSFFFSYDLDLTRRMDLLKGTLEALIRSKLDSLVSSRPYFLGALSNSWLSISGIGTLANQYSKPIRTHS